MSFYTFSNGTVADADEVNYNLNWIKQVTDKNMYLQIFDYIGSDAEGIPSFFSGSLNTTEINTGNTTSFYNKYLCAMANIYDLTNDSSLDSNLWTTEISYSGQSNGYVTEDTEKIRLYCHSEEDDNSNVYLVAQGSTAGSDINLIDGGEVVFSFRVSLSIIGDSTSNDAYLRIGLTDGTTRIPLITYFRTGGQAPFDETYENARILVDAIGSTAKFYRDGIYTSSISYSTLTGSILPYFAANNTSASNTNYSATTNTYIYGMGYIYPTDTTDYYIETTMQELPVESDRWHISVNDYNFGNITMSNSIDDGSTYVSMNNGTSEDFTISGSELILKATGSAPIVPIDDVINIPVFNNYGVIKLNYN